MKKMFILASFAMLAGLLIAAGPAAYGMMGGPGCAMGHSHGCNGSGGMMNHVEFNGHCNHEAGNYPGGYLGSKNCCGDPGWIDPGTPSTPPPSSSLGIGSAGNNAKAITKAVSTRPRFINSATD